MGSHRSSGHRSGERIIDAATVRDLYGDGFVVHDAGEVVRLLLYVRRPDGRFAGRRWVVLPRSGFVQSLLRANEEMRRIGRTCGSPDGPAIH